MLLTPTRHHLSRLQSSSSLKVSLQVGCVFQERKRRLIFACVRIGPTGCVLACMGPYVGRFLPAIDGLLARQVTCVHQWCVYELLSQQLLCCIMFCKMPRWFARGRVLNQEAHCSRTKLPALSTTPN